MVEIVIKARMGSELEKARALAILAVQHYADVASVEETNFTGWGNGDVPKWIEFQRKDADRCLRMLLIHLPNENGQYAVPEEPREIPKTIQNTNTGHGHVFPRPDGMKARCGGPMICSECAKDLARSGMTSAEWCIKQLPKGSGRGA